jgi:hypothetical protein
MTHDSITIAVGPDVRVQLTSTGNLSLSPREGKTRQFLINGPAVLSLCIRRGLPPQLGEMDLLLDSGGLWKVFRKENCHIFIIQEQRSPQPFIVVMVDFHNGRGDVYLNNPDDHPIFPFDYPLDEVIFSKLLADRGSIIVHACGVIYNGSGILFPGHSGAGKSTLSQLLSRYPGVKVLSDDRVVVGAREGIVHISGTPWLGSAGFALPESAPLRRILFLHHDAANRIEPMSAIDATTQLLGLSVLPYWDAGSVEKAIEAGARAVERIPAERFGFVPDASVAEYLFHAIDFAQR